MCFISVKLVLFSEEHLLMGDTPELGINHAGQKLFKWIILPNRASLDTHYITEYLCILMYWVHPEDGAIVLFI